MSMSRKSPSSEKVHLAKTVGELIAALEKYPKGTPVITDAEDGFVTVRRWFRTDPYRDRDIPLVVIGDATYDESFEEDKVDSYSVDAFIFGDDE